jgi:PAS domain S-box-containing protein
MEKTTTSAREGRVLVFVSTSGDEILFRTILTRVGLECHVCQNLNCLRQELEVGADVILLSDEALADELDCLIEAIRLQPSWSDVPVLLLTSEGADTRIAIASLELLGHVIVLERTVPMASFVSVLRAAVRARRRQYQSRDNMDALARTLEFQAGDGNFFRLMERLPIGMYICDSQGLITYFNREAAQLWGRTLKLNDPVDRFCGSFKLYGTDGTPIAHDQCWMALSLRTGREYGGREIVIERPDGTRLTVLPHSSPIRDAFGKLQGAFNVIVDVSDRIRSEQAVKEGEERFRAVVENAMEPILLIDNDGRLIYGNPITYRLLGYSRQEFPQMTVQDITPPQNRGRVPVLLARLLSEGTLSGDSLLLCKDGTTRQVEYRSVANILPGIHLVVYRDITERKQAERAMRENHALLHAVIEGIPQAIYVKDRQGRYLMINTPGARLIGKDPREVLGRDDYALFEPESAGQFTEEDRNLMESGESKTYEHYGTSDGITRRFISSKAPFRGAQGEVLGVVGISRDITEWSRAQDELNRQREQLREQLAEIEHIYRYAPVGLVFLDRDLRFVRLNEQLATMNGRSVAEHLGRTIRQIIPELADFLEPVIRRVIISAEPILNLEFQGITDAEPSVQRHWLGSYFPLKSDDGTIAGVTAAVMEVTQLKRAEAHLREYAEREKDLTRQLLTIQEEERANLARELHDEFGQMLTAIHATLHNLKSHFGPESHAYLEEAAALVSSGIEQVRQISFDLRPESLDVLGLEAALRGLVLHHRQRNNLDVQLDGYIDASLRPELRIACYRVVQEALTNVVRHAQVNRVRVKLQQEDVWLIVSVQDDGIGFDVAKVRRGVAEGRNLGILGMQERVEHLGGQFIIGSVPGSGTTICTRFQIAPGAEEAVTGEGKR